MDHSEVKHLPKVDHTPAVLDDASKLLLKMADVIETRGHCQHLAEDSKGRVCIVGATNYTGTIKGWCEVIDRMERAMGQRFIEWNNTPGRTKEEVVAKLRAIAFLRV
ncbi:MAG TPA: hypothetical protein VF516_03385 [Kofleriaceae bacterium]